MICNVRGREASKIKANMYCGNIDLGTITESVSRDHNLKNLVSIMEGWKSLGIDEEESFNKLKGIVESYTDGYKNDNKEIKKYIDECIYGVKNIKSMKQDIKDLYTSIDESADNEIEMYITLDRINKNKRVLEENGIDIKYDTERILSNHGSYLQVIKCVKEQLDNFSIPERTKINTLYENTLYAVEMYKDNVDYERFNDDFMALVENSTMINDNIIFKMSIDIAKQYPRLKPKMDLDISAMVKELRDLHKNDIESLSKLYNSLIKKYNLRLYGNRVVDIARSMWTEVFRRIATIDDITQEQVDMLLNFLMLAKTETIPTRYLYELKSYFESLVVKNDDNNGRVVIMLNYSIRFHINGLQSAIDYRYSSSLNEEAEVSIYGKDYDMSTKDYFNDFHDSFAKNVENMYNLAANTNVSNYVPTLSKNIRSFSEANISNIRNYVDSLHCINVKIGTFDNYMTYNEATSIEEGEAKAEEDLNKFMIALEERKPEYIDLHVEGDQYTKSIICQFNSGIMVEEAGIDFDDTEKEIISRNLDTMNALEEMYKLSALKNISMLESYSYDDVAVIKSIAENTDCYSKDIYNSMFDYMNNKEKSISAKVALDECRAYVNSNYFVYNENTNLDQVYNLEAFREAFFDKDKARVNVSRVKNKVSSLYNKQKEISNRIDSTVDKIFDDADKKMSDSNRERIIKGSVLPKFSTLIKLAIANAGIGIAINPVIGVIGFVGSLAINAKTSQKEKQLIMDDIDINLKLIEKRMAIADSNNDIKAMDELMRMEKKLKREKQRIKYNGKARDFRINSSNM